MERLTHDKAVELIKSVKRKFAGQLELEIRQDQRSCALFWVTKKGYWNCQGHRRLWKNGVHLAYVYQDREYTSAKDLNFRYDDDSLLNPIIKEVETNVAYSIFDDEYKEKLERACQEAVKCNKVLKMTDHERDFNIALKLVRENTWKDNVGNVFVLSDESYKNGKDIRRVGLAYQGDKVVLRRLAKIPKMKTILYRFTKEESSQIIAEHHYRQSQLRLMTESK